MSLAIVSSESVAGPRVHTIFARRTRPSVVTVDGTRLPDLAHLVQRSAKWAARLASAVPAGLDRPRARVGLMHGGWTTAQPLELHGPSISNARTDLQRPYPTLTPVGRPPAPAQALDLCTYVGQAHSRWSRTARRSPTPVPISNARTQLSRLWVGRPPRCRRWSCTARRSPTPVPTSNARTQLSRLCAGERPTFARPSGSTTAQHVTHQTVTARPSDSRQPTDPGPPTPPRADVGVMYKGWTTAQPLELHGPSISNARTDLQRPDLTLTPVGRLAPPSRGRVDQPPPSTSRIRQ